MKAIVFIGTLKTGSSRDALKAAFRLGYIVIVLTNRMGQVGHSDDYPEVTAMIYCDLRDYEMTNRVIRQLDYDIASIVGFVEPFCYLASQLALDFGIGKFSANAILTMQNKLLSRNALKGSSYTPWFKIIENFSTLSNEEIHDMLPFVMKYPNSTGSKEVYLIKTYEEFVYTRNQLIEKFNEPIIIEEYLNGPQYLVECLVVKKRVKIVAIIKQDISYINGHFIVTGYNLVLDSQPIFNNRIKKAVEEIIKLHKMETGACHLEVRYVNGGFKLIEINPRISGGAMNQFIEIGLGINLVEETLKLSLGEKLDVTPKYKKYTHAEYIVLSNSGVLLEINGVNAAINSRGVRKVYVKPRIGARIHPPMSLADRYAYVIANGKNEQEAKENALRAARKIGFNILIMNSLF